MTTPTRDDGQDDQIRALATQIAQMTKLGYDPATIRKGVISAVSDTTTPPTVSLNLSGDSETLVTQVRTLNNYTPLVGQTVLIAKQGADIFILGSIASVNPSSTTNTTSDNGWIQATLTAGSHNGNSNGNVKYRRIMDHGSWKMQWQGGWNVSGTTMVTGLDPDYRPSARRSLIVARDATGANDAKLDFNTDGSVLLVGGTTAPSGTGSTGLNGAFSIGDHGHTYLDIYGAAGEFNYTGATSATGGFSVGNHSHSVTVTNAVTAPTWVSLNGLEYFL